MTELFSRLFRTGSSDLRRRTIGVYAVLIVANVAAWLWAISLYRDRPILLGTALIAYGFGLRHAVDPDHIAAIDNVTRKLVQERKRPVTVGFWFALGHSAVVALGAMLIAMASVAMGSRFDAFKDIGGVISTVVSSLFLFAIAGINLVVLRSVYRSFRAVRNGGGYEEEDFSKLLNGRGLLARLFRPMFRLVTQSWHMLPLGFLFGLGFDTATEIGLLGIAAAEAAKGVSLSGVMVFPALFAAGMSLIDTTDGVLMLHAYDWAFVKPIRKLYYNLTITLVSVIVAVAIGGIEALGLIAEKLKMAGTFWDAVGALNGNFNTLGFIVIGVFLASWILSVAIYYGRGFDKMELAAASDR
ncbi:HoxN/HupN/NixA family nickel/cobalt transporter [Rhodopila sp.]|uniref:HoxN/HupN/NixA family nickel/cobalt transporter n=1 Tax=Rhodopila sp. TaxID=2480087 RepID=UPI003D0D35B4